MFLVCRNWEMCQLHFRSSLSRLFTHHVHVGLTDVNKCHVKCIKEKNAAISKPIEKEKEWQLINAKQRRLICRMKLYLSSI